MSKKIATRMSCSAVAFLMAAAPVAAGGGMCGNFYCWTNDAPVIDDHAHIGLPGEEPPGDENDNWELQHSHASYNYKNWHDFANDGWLEDSEEGVHNNCGGGGGN